MNHFTEAQHYSRAHYSCRWSSKGRRTKKWSDLARTLIQAESMACPLRQQSCHRATILDEEWVSNRRLVSSLKLGELEVKKSAQFKQKPARQAYMARKNRWHRPTVK